jgi:hypothetical protein
MSPEHSGTISTFRALGSPVKASAPRRPTSQAAAREAARKQRLAEAAEREAAQDDFFTKRRKKVVPVVASDESQPSNRGEETASSASDDGDSSPRRKKKKKTAYTLPSWAKHGAPPRALSPSEEEEEDLDGDTTVRATARHRRRTQRARVSGSLTPPPAGDREMLEQARRIISDQLTIKSVDAAPSSPRAARLRSITPSRRALGDDSDGVADEAAPRVLEPDLALLYRGPQAAEIRRRAEEEEQRRQARRRAKPAKIAAAAAPAARAPALAPATSSDSDEVEFLPAPPPPQPQRRRSASTARARAPQADEERAPRADEDDFEIVGVAPSQRVAAAAAAVAAAASSSQQVAAAAASSQNVEHISITLRGGCEGKLELPVRVKPTTTIGTLLDHALKTWSEQKQRRARILYDGETLARTETISGAGIEEDEYLEVRW